MSLAVPAPSDPWADATGTLAEAARQLPAFLLRQRWYPAKDRGAPTVALDALRPLAGAGVPAVLAVWTAEPPGRPCIRLFMPLILLSAEQLPPAHPAIVGRTSLGLIADGFASDEFVRAFVRLLLITPAAADTGEPELWRAGHTRLAPSRLEPGAEWTIRRSSAEQSNTSIRIGDGAILKVIRKLERGVHPELAMGRHLSERAGFGATPGLLAWAVFNDSTVAILQAFVVNEGDGWSWVLGRLRSGSPGELERARAWIGRLGTTTAQLHLALAQRTGDPAFDPEPASEEDWRRWMQAILAMADRVCASMSGLQGEARTAALQFARRRAALPGLLRSLIPAGGAAQKSRHHGDYHLGQVLVCGDAAVIVDFEGEPLRPLAERRAKQIPLRDVAGMLRSLAYAAAASLRERTDGAVAAAHVEAAQDLGVWVGNAQAMFLEQYLRTLACGTTPVREEASMLRMVRFFTIEKALYEVLYEVANRPDWAAIPLAGLALLVSPDAASATTRAHRMPQGAELLEGGGVRLRLWAPACTHVSVEIQGRSVPGVPEAAVDVPLQAVGHGWHETTLPHAGAGTRYRFVLPDGLRIPDPASRFQPEDVKGPSEVIDPTAFPWRDGDWQGRPWHEAVLYELHVGAFTPEGTFRAAMERLDHLAALGVTAIEVMPVADFPGARNWGYDGVLLYAPDSTYGRPEDFKAFIEAAHARGLMVLLDVVYNHFGPDGNYLPLYAPGFFTDRHRTPWGAGVNFDGADAEPVREFIIHNALYWLEEYHLDGLRLDAVHAILDDGAAHVLTELAERVRAVGRPVHLVLENEENRVSRLRRDAGGVPLEYTAQWNDDVHHVLHVAATGESQGYYAEYAGKTELLGRALAEGFAFQGEMMAFRGSARGEPSGVLPPTAFVAFVQNHDQIGNRAFGERLGALAPEAAVRALTALYLLLPQIPMLFMGEEWQAAEPFPFFCDFAGELKDAVREGRRLEFAKFPEFQDAATRERIPDPQAEATYASAKLCWPDLAEPRAAAWLDFYRRLLAVRRARVMPLLAGIGSRSGRYETLGPGAVVVRWRLGAPTEEGAAPAGELELVANLSAVARGRGPVARGEILWQEGAAAAGDLLSPWSVRWSLTTPGTSQPGTPQPGTPQPGP